MTDFAKNVKSGIDTAAEVAKDTTGKTPAALAKAAKNAGEAVRNVGQKIKEAGKLAGFQASPNEFGDAFHS